MHEKISLAGDLGSGKSTVAKLLLERLGATYYSTGAIVREIAERRGMTVGELNVYMETHPEIDREIDDGLIALSDRREAMIIDSRMAWHFTRGTFKVYLSTDPTVSAKRIMEANRRGEHAASLEATVEETRARRASEKKRYYEKYGVDITDLTNYSAVIDTTYISPEEAAECILSALRRSDESDGTTALISPRRIWVTKGDELRGEGTSCICESDGAFYLTEAGELGELSAEGEPPKLLYARLAKGAPKAGGEYQSLDEALAAKR